MILIIDLCYRKNSLSYDEFVKPIEKIVKNDYTVKHFTKITKKDIKKSDKIILCGNALMDFEFMKRVKDFEWLKYYSKPILGICAGTEIVNLVFNGKLKKDIFIGMKNIKINPNKLTDKEELEVYEIHSYSLKIPKEFEKLSGNNEIIKHKEKEIYCLMFHPEVRNEDMIRNFIK